MMYCPQCNSDKMSKWADKAQSGRNRWRCGSCKSRTTRPLTEPAQDLPKFKKQSRKTYIITQAVNDTKIVVPFLRTLEHMAQYLDAQLVIVKGVYKNPDMVKRGFLETLSWPSEILPYFCDADFKIGKHLIVRGGTRIQHTAINPLSGMNHAGGTYSEIFAHPQLAMECIPAPKNEIPRVLYTTGTVSQRNYGGSPTAKKASFHHNNCALLVETQGDRFWIRPISWAKNHVQDLQTRYYPTGHVEDAEVEAAVYGDVHADALSKKESDCLLSFMRKVEPKKHVLHDVLDMHTGSHHKQGDVLTNLRNPDHDVAGELYRTCDFLSKIPGKAVIIPSNHHDHLGKWFNSVNPRKEQVNLDIYYQLANLARHAGGDLFRLYCEYEGVNCHFADRNEVYDICGIDVSQHGDRGPNGARGSTKAFARTGRKTISGHSHTPRIEKGAWTVGTSAMGMSYATGYSSWLIAHALIYPNGKRTMIFQIKGRFSPMVEAL
jgi:hypothetical protein